MVNLSGQAKARTTYVLLARDGRVVPLAKRRTPHSKSFSLRQFPAVAAWAAMHRQKADPKYEVRLQRVEDPAWRSAARMQTVWVRDPGAPNAKSVKGDSADRSTSQGRQCKSMQADWMSYQKGAFDCERRRERPSLGRAWDKRRTSAGTVAIKRQRSGRCARSVDQAPDTPSGHRARDGSLL